MFGTLLVLWKLFIIYKIKYKVNVYLKETRLVMAVDYVQ